jgi:sugar (pentulose or hexulose) kinase
MKRTPVIAVFDVGKTNKKLFLFDESYHIVFERSARFNEIEDEDGFPCENLESLELSVFDSLNEISRLEQFELKAVNFSAYGASFVYLDENGKPVAPLYNYLKPYPEDLKKQFYDTYDNEAKFSFQTASPALGSLNSGLQLYRIKYQKPELFKRIKYALHLPQYLSYLISGQKFSDLTSIGCHTALWDFKRNSYHDWVIKEGIIDKLPPIQPSDKVVFPTQPNSNLKVGIGLHDSSAALIPYLVSFKEPFILLSTGTWAISLNPFNQSPLTEDELKNDCLNYVQYNGKTVKAARLFSGREYDEGIKQIATQFNQDVMKYRNLVYEVSKVRKTESPKDGSRDGKIGDEEAKLKVSPTGGDLEGAYTSGPELADAPNDIEAYYKLMGDIIQQQKSSTEYVLKGTQVNRIFVDGGFSKNNVFMHLLAATFPKLEVYAASMAQATALGAALAIHNHWNTKPIPQDLIALKHYAGNRE